MVVSLLILFMREALLFYFLEKKVKFIEVIGWLRL